MILKNRLPRYKDHCMSLVLLFVTVFYSLILFFSVFTSMRPAQAQVMCGDDKNFISASIHVPVNAEYAIWLQSALEIDRPEKVQILFVETGDCLELSPPMSGDFDWTSVASGNRVTSLSAGNQELRLAVSGGSLRAKSLLLTSNTQCVPVSDGNNCIDVDVDITINGLQPNQTIDRTMQVSTTIASTDVASPEVEYYFDDSSEVFATAKSQPFCLFKEANSCVAGDVSFLDAGQHTLKVVIKALNMDSTIRIVPFTVTKQVMSNSSYDNNSNESVELPSNEAKSTDGATVVANILNAPTNSATNQAVTTVAPTRPLSSGDTVSYSINGVPTNISKITEQDTNPAEQLDVSQYEGKVQISATIDRQNGSSEIYTTSLNVDNGAKAKIKKWLGDGGLKRSSEIVGVCMLVLSGIYGFRFYKRRNSYLNMHNLNDYEYIKPQYNTVAYSLPLSTLSIFLFGFVITSIVGATPIKIGVIADLTQSAIPVTYRIVTTNTERYVLMNSETAPIDDGSSDPDPAPSETAGEFYTKDGYIGRNGKRFVAIGVNGVPTARTAYQNPGQWWNDTGMGIMNGKGKAYASYGFNFVRLNDMRDYDQFSFRDYQDGLFDTIDEYTALGITCMPTYHRLGAGSDPTPAEVSTNSDYQAYWSEIVDKYKSNPNVWINPINEPIGNAHDEWESISEYQYEFIRSLGWTGMIVIDLPQWAQGIDIGTPRLVAFMEGKSNLAIGFHNYDMGEQSAAVTDAQRSGVPIILAEVIHFPGVMHHLKCG